MSEQQQANRRTKEVVRELVETSPQAPSSLMQEEIFDDDIFISDLVQESMDIAKVFKQKGGQ